MSILIIAFVVVQGHCHSCLRAFPRFAFHIEFPIEVLKPLADEAYADGINHFVWHTFTCSPKKFGVPGAEYFAGSHINRNVTWHNELAPFIKYLTRCQGMLQQGLPVADYAVYAGDRPYQHWGRYRDKPYDSSKAKLPAGYTLVEASQRLFSGSIVTFTASVFSPRASNVL